MIKVREIHKEWTPRPKGNVFTAKCKRGCGFEITWHMPETFSGACCDWCGGELAFTPTGKYFKFRAIPNGGSP
jgi:hypothetical protein